jgi:hypothetical protein
LRIVEEHHVSPSQSSDRAGGVGGGHVRVVVGLASSEFAAVASDTVKAIVETLSDGKEFGVAAHNEPSAVDTGILCIADQHLKHLRNPSARGGRAHIPDGPSPKGPTSAGGRISKGAVTLRTDQRFEPRQRTDGNGDLPNAMLPKEWFA